MDNTRENVGYTIRSTAPSDELLRGVRLDPQHGSRSTIHTGTTARREGIHHHVALRLKTEAEHEGLHSLFMRKHTKLVGSP